MDFTSYLNPDIAPITNTVNLAREQSPLDTQNFIPFHKATDLMKSGYFEVENGYCINTDGSLQIAVLTDMPSVTPAMWDWWFGWHGDDSRRYKLWHPQAHEDIQWKDNILGKQEYINRTSIATETIGTTSEKLAIQFKRPSSLGLTDFSEESSDVVYIVAQLGLATIPLNMGWLIHQVRKTENGSEMRSRFWLGGQYVVARDGNALFKMVAPIARRLRKIPKTFGDDLMLHCAEEMSHLASFLPSLYNDMR